MSIVVALKDSDGDCWLACDSQVTINDLKSPLSESQSKIFYVPERPGCMMGHVGYLRGLNILETNNCYIDELTCLKEEISYEYVVNAVPSAIYALFKARQFVEDDEQAIINLKGDSLLVANKQVYYIDEDGGVAEIKEFGAIGTGCELAIGSLESTKGMAPIDRLQAAIKAAYRNIFCSGHICIMCDNPAKTSR